MADKSITARRGGDKGEGDFVNAPLSLTLSHEGEGISCWMLSSSRIPGRMITSVKSKKDGKLEDYRKESASKIHDS